MQNEAFYNGAKQTNLESIFKKKVGFLRLIIIEIELSCMLQENGMRCAKSRPLLFSP